MLREIKVGEASYTAKNGRCVDPLTSKPFKAKQMRKVEVTDLELCKVACDDNDGCMAHYFTKDSCSLITGVTPLEGDDEDGVMCNIKND